MKNIDDDISNSQQSKNLAYTPHDGSGVDWNANEIRKTPKIKKGTARRTRMHVSVTSVNVWHDIIFYVIRILILVDKIRRNNQNSLR